MKRAILACALTLVVGCSEEVTLESLEAEGVEFTCDQVDNPCADGFACISGVCEPAGSVAPTSDTTSTTDTTTAPDAEAPGDAESQDTEPPQDTTGPEDTSTPEDTTGPEDTTDAVSEEVVEDVTPDTSEEVVEDVTDDTSEDVPPPLECPIGSDGDPCGEGGDVCHGGFGLADLCAESAPFGADSCECVLQGCGAGAHDVYAICEEIDTEGTCYNQVLSLSSGECYEGCEEGTPAPTITGLFAVCQHPDCADLKAQFTEAGQDLCGECCQSAGGDGIEPKGPCDEGQRCELYTDVAPDGGQVAQCIDDTCQPGSCGGTCGFCTGETPWCVEGTCQVCEKDVDCLDGDAPYCATDGPGLNTCEVCTATQGCTDDTGN
ncbi:MAG: hypothetical protein VX938_10685, partial [Myxococcota bacterium]|nr:hypothetical protein [Myxococcota bacterium]